MAQGNQVATRSRNDLTDKQAAFVEFMVASGDASASAERAGYQSHPSKAAFELLKSANVLVALQLAVHRALVADAPVARAVILEIATNTTCAARVRLDAAKTLLDRAGHVAPRPREDESTANTPLHEMSTAELRELATRLEGEIAGRARPISATLDAGPDYELDLVG